MRATAYRAFRANDANAPPDTPVEPVKVLAVHNRYRQRGGEDLVFEEETALLEQHGHEVVRYVENNDRVSGLSRTGLAKSSVFNTSTYRGLRSCIQRERPGVIHFHNTLPLISPAGYYAAASENVPVVQTLHNYRLLCPNGLFFRDGRPCEDCLGRAFAWPGIAHGCYRESWTATGLIAATTLTHEVLGTWKSKIDLYVTPTEFARRKFIEGGFPEERIKVKPNFVSPDPGVGTGAGGYALFVGRLSREKGVETLLAAWNRPEVDGIPLKIAGDGPLADLVSRSATSLPSVEWVGRCPAEQVGYLMRNAAMLVMPSGAYETFGRVAAESLAAGTPVIVSGTGAATELVTAGRTGLHFRSEDAADLARQVRHLAAEPQVLARMRRNARAAFEERYTAARNYQMLVDIYEAAIERARDRTGSRMGSRTGTRVGGRG